MLNIPFWGIEVKIKLHCPTESCPLSLTNGLLTNGLLNGNKSSYHSLKGVNISEM